MYKQELRVKDSFLKLHAWSQELPTKPDPICITKQKFRFENEGERDFEKKRTDEIPYTNLCSLLDVTLFVHASLFFFSLCLCCVCLIALFLCFHSFFFLFFFLCVTLSIYREIPKKLFPYFLSTDQLMEQFASVFLSTTPNFVFSRAPLFPFFRQLAGYSTSFEVWGFISILLLIFFFFFYSCDVNSLILR